MGLLEKLWDETLAGPTPESGLGKLRNYNKINLTVSVDSTTAPNSPNSTTPASASASRGGGGGNLNKLSRRKSAAAAAAASPKSPTGYDWIVLSALDR